MQEAKMREVILAGLSGGAAWWAAANARGGQPVAEIAPFPPTQWFWISLALSAVLGSASAFLMVYYVATTDTRQRTKALGFALLCGFCWDPVLVGATRRMTQDFADRSAARTLSEASHLEKRADPTARARAADLALDLVRDVPNVQNPILRDAASDEASRLLEMVEQAPEATARAEALGAIGVAAAEARDEPLLAQTVRSLELIAAAPVEARHP